MNEPRDEIDALRQAWKQLQVPEGLAHDAPGDTETQACMDWMIAAWVSLEVPPARIPVRPVVSVRRHVLRHVMPFAAAASLVVMLRMRRQEPQPGADTRHSVEIALAEPAEHVIRPIIHADGSIETRSGNVRLILLPEQASEPEASPAGASTTSSMEK